MSKNKKYQKKLLLVCSFMLILQFQAFAWLRLHIQDGMLVESSELIVIGHLKKESIVYVPVPEATGARRNTYHVTLAVTKVLKGQTVKTEIPIIVHHGLALRVDGEYPRADQNKAGIEILDTGSSTVPAGLIVKDAGKDHIWFIARLDERGQKSHNGKHGIINPEDVQPTNLELYFMAYLAENPEQAVRQYTEENPELANRVKGYLDHLQVLRILEIKDPNERLQQLMPFYLRGACWNHMAEARDGIIACGQIAGPALMDVYKRSPRNDILRVLGGIRYRGCVPFLIELLEKNDRFWAGQELEENWWNKADNPSQRKQRQEIYHQTYYAVSALKDIGDPRAKEIIQQVLNRWKKIDFDNPQIVVTCEQALQHIGLQN